MLIKLILENYIPLQKNGINYVELDVNHMVNLFIAQNGVGKGQTLTSKIKVPDGWKRMRDMKVGDEVITRDGSITKVTGVFPQGIKQVYRVHFADGRFTDVDDTHLWKVFNVYGKSEDRWDVVNTLELIRLRETGRTGQWIYVPLCESERNKDKVFKIHPYLMGVLLGDGGFSGSSGVLISKPYQQLFDKVEDLLPAHLMCKWRPCGISFSVVNKDTKTMFNKEFWHPREELKQQGLMGKRSWEKTIPFSYLNGSRKQRLELLQGLLDTDGTVDKKGSISFSSSSENLSTGVQYLVRSLGGYAKMRTRIPTFTYKGEKKDGRMEFRVFIRYPNPEELFTLEHKKQLAIKTQYSDRLKLKIVNIEKRTPEKTQCIAVEHPEHLYVTDDFIVTHNTSILKEVNQLPPESADFEAGGRKYGEWKIDGKHYVFDSYTGVSDGHSFKLNGEELNKGGTFMAQKELCWTHFKLDRPRARFLSGLKVYDLFSNLTPTRRKEILLWLYPNDTGYAMTVFNRLKSERNELKAVLKNQVSRYADESEKLKRITECGVEELETRIKHIDEDLRKSLLLRGSLEEYKINPTLRQKIEEFEYLTTALTVNKVSGFIETETELVEGIEITERLISGYEENISSLQHTIGEHAGLLEGVEEYLQDPLLFQNQAEQLETEINELKQTIKEQTTLLSDQPVFGEEEMDLKGLDLVYDTLVAQLHCVVNANDSSINGAIFKQMEVQLNQLNNKIQEHKSNLTAGMHHLRHYDNAEAVECPDCKHNFKVGMNEKDIHRVKADVENWTSAITRLEQERDVVADKIDNDKQWYDSMIALHQFVRLRGDVPCLGVLVKEFNVGKSEISNLLNALRAFKERFDASKRIESLLEEKNLIETRIGLMNRDNVLDVAAFVEGWECDLVKDQNKLAFYNRRLKTFNGRLTIIRNYARDLAKLDELKEEIFQSLLDEGYVKFRKQLDERINILTEEKEDYLRSIINSRSLSAVVESIHDEVLRLRKRLVIVETWMDKLCPNKGFIGKLLTDFIKTFCGNTNAMIQDVWNTPLYVKPCNKANGDLTYKFPVVVGDSKPVPDMSDCSLGQTGIIDFAVRLTALIYHGYFPLIMDEVGTNLDEVKRTRFFNFVRELAQKKDARQIFCVSHYLSSFGVFSKPNVVAMKHDGLTLPAEPNRNNTIN